MSVQPGDIVLFHGPNFFSRLIRFGQALRFHGDKKPYAYWNHVAVVVDVVNGEPIIVEAVKRVEKNNLWNSYSSSSYTVRIVEVPNLSDEDRNEIVSFCDSQVGDEYDWLEIGSMALRCLFGGKLTFQISDAHICSGLAGEALERAGYDFGIDAAALMPADIAEYFNVTP